MSIKFRLKIKIMRNLNNKMEFEMMDNKILCDIETKNYKGEVVIIIQGNSYEYIFIEKD